MKRTIFVGFAAAGLLAGASVASATGDQPKSSQTSSAQTGTSQGTSASATHESQLSGKIASIDKDKKSVTISSDSGTQQEVKVSDSTNIMRDGSSIGLAQLQSGDEVRASFDPSTKQATTLEVKTKQKKQ
jgi:hypothetical protein